MEYPWYQVYKAAGIDPTIQMPPEDSSLLDVFDRNFKKFRGETALLCMDKTMSYDELDKKSRQFAAYLQSLGLPEHTRVAVMLPNLLQYPVAALGIIRAGMIMVNVNPLYKARELEHQLNDADARVIVILENFAHVFQEIAANTPVKYAVVTSVGEMLGPIKGTVVNFVLKHIQKQVPVWTLNNAITFSQALKIGENSPYTRPSLTLNSSALLQYTGGTTGVAKGADLMHGNLIANLLQVDKLFQSLYGKEEAQKEKFLCALPLYHIFAFTVCGLFGMFKGSTIILVPNPRDIPGLAKIFSKYKPGFFPGVNTLFNALLQNAEFRNTDHSSLRVTMGGGMAVLSATALEWQKITGKPIIEGYGLSETSPVVCANPPSNKMYTGTIGVPVSSTDVILLNDENERVPVGEPGELCVKGPQVMRGYWNRPDETALVMTPDGFFRTGDIAIMDELGQFKIVDRKKDMISVSGFKVYPQEVEEVMSRHPKVLETGVVGVPDERSGEVPKLFVVKKDPSLTAEELNQYARENLTGYKRPHYIQFVDDLPKSNVGKILRKDLRNIDPAGSFKTS